MIEFRLWRGVRCARARTTKNQKKLLGQYVTRDIICQVRIPELGQCVRPSPKGLTPPRLRTLTSPIVGLPPGSLRAQLYMPQRYGISREVEGWVHEGSVTQGTQVTTILGSGGIALGGVYSSENLPSPSYSALDFP